MGAIGLCRNGRPQVGVMRAQRACRAVLGRSGASSHVGLQKTGQLMDEGKNGWAMRVGWIGSLFVQACWASLWWILRQGKQASCCWVWAIGLDYWA